MPAQTNRENLSGTGNVKSGSDIMNEEVVDDGTRLFMRVSTPMIVELEKLIRSTFERELRFELESCYCG